MDIKAKLEKETNKLNALKDKRAAIDEKIMNAEKEVARIKGIISQKKFDEMSDVLSGKGLTIDEILRAVESGDVSALQNKIEEKV